MSNYYEEAKKRVGFVQACNDSEILVRTAYEEALKDILDMAGIEEYSVNRIDGINEFLRKYSEMLEELNKQD